MVFNLFTFEINLFVEFYFQKIRLDMLVGVLHCIRRRFGSFRHARLSWVLC